MMIAIMIMILKRISIIAWLYVYLMELERQEIFLQPYHTLTKHLLTHITIVPMINLTGNHWPKRLRICAPQLLTNLIMKLPMEFN